ncbi:hypothetical protein [Chryseolinea lacunae]|uniref:DUF4595 domain-containing protein n=1 Tax=Chryseolinea lacunae TaxID=2801331 RepID=A0ABS1KNJ8_9BACT|nr:hypothetical protein [Chryseolinea lacunae]MBL0741001.1 hypothetical protein [Chryseolinea lacunae]
MKKILKPSLLLFALLSVLYACDTDEIMDPEKPEDPSDETTVHVKANVKLDIGGVLYENVDATLQVRGYDANGEAQWTKDFSFVGPTDNVLDVKNGYHHYSIALVNKWGINDVQPDISASTLWDGRADGSVPVTYVLGGSKPAKKLARYVTWREVDLPDGGVVYQPVSKVQFTYDASGHLAYIVAQAYNDKTSKFEDTTTDTFFFEGDAVSKIITTLNGQPYSNYVYTYGAETKIKATLLYANLVATQTTKRDDTNNHIDVTYNYSNGNAFVYAFDFAYKNIVSDKTTKDKLCNTGTYTYDKNINPLRHLGYQDINLVNWSASNKLTEDVHYIACSFPTLLPVKHDYTYDADGYPVTKITTYAKGTIGGSIPDPSHHGKVEYFYE